MADNEKDVERRVDKLETKFDMFMQEMREFKTEMRDFKTEMCQQNQMRAEEIRDLQRRQDEDRRKHDADMKAAQIRHDADMKEMNAKIEANAKEFTKQLHTNFIQTMLGVGAIMAAIGGLIIAALK